MGMRIKGCTYEVIGKALGVSTKTAWKYVTRSLEETLTETAESTEHLRSIELSGLQEQERKIMEIEERWFPIAMF